MGEGEPANATWTNLRGFLRDDVGQVQEGRGGWDSDRGFCLLPPPRHAHVDAGSDKKHAFVTTMITIMAGGATTWHPLCTSHASCSRGGCVGAFQSRSAPRTRTGTTGAWCPWCLWRRWRW